MITSKVRISPPVLSWTATEIVNKVLARNRRVLLYGPPGVGKSTLAMQIGQVLAKMKRGSCCLSADPGSPSFGLPGAITLGEWRSDFWRIVAYRALCSLDAGRFRLPLLLSVQQLVRIPLDAVLLIDSPGVVRGVAGRELLAGLVEVANVEVILALTASPSIPLLDELQSTNVELFVIRAVDKAARPGKRVRDRNRTIQWDAYLKNAIMQQLDLSRIGITGTPPPLDVESAWAGRQIALLNKKQTLALGEVQSLHANRLNLLLPYSVTDTDTLLVRDVQRNPNGLITTSVPFATKQAEKLTAVTATPVPPLQSVISMRVGVVDVLLVNSVFDDPLLHVHLRHQRRSLLFDLGEGQRLSARIAHQVTDVFISHAHMDHIGGFMWLLRSRIGAYPCCRLYGPPGLSKHVEGFLQAILWDRIGENAPCFEVNEISEERILRYALQADCSGRQLLADQSIVDDVILQDSGFKVRAIVLDHRGIPVVAYAFEPDIQINIRKDKLVQLGLAPGPWLSELKQNLLDGKTTTSIKLSDGSKCSTEELGDKLTLVNPGRKLVYATDLADSLPNRQRLVELAKSAHTFFCEAAFSVSNAEQAMRHGHLTTRACGEIAEAAQVSRLVPFHFSRRYSNDPQQLYEEIQAVCSCVVIPASPDWFETVV